MKTLSGTFAFVVLAVIAIVTLPSCCRKQVSKKDECPTDKSVLLRFGKPGTEKTPTEYVEVNKDDFDKVLCRLNKKQYYVDFLPDAKATPIPDYTPSCSRVSINTDKITTARVVQAEPAEESSAYDPNVVYHVKSNSLQEIKDVLDTFKSPTPTPTPH